MSGTNTSNDTHVNIASNLDAGSAGEAHAALLAGLDAAESTGAVTALELVGDDAPSPLCLQLLVSAKLSFPPGTFRPGATASDALSALQTSKVI